MDKIIKRISLSYHHPKNIQTLNDLSLSVQNFDLISLVHHRLSNQIQQTKQFLPALDFDRTKQQSKILKSISKNGPTFSYLVLQWIGKVHRHSKSTLVDHTSYLELMETYFSDLKATKSSQFKLCNNFCFLENSSVISSIKKNQLNFVNNLNKSQLLTSNQFQRIIHPSFFNITDMPKIYELFYQFYFPSINALKTTDELHHCLIYLAKFSRIPYFLPKKILKQIQENLQTNNEIDHFQLIKMMNMIYLLKFKFPISLSETDLIPSFQSLHQELIVKYMKLNNIEERTSQQIENLFKNKPLDFLQALKRSFQNQFDKQIINKKQKLLQYNKNLDKYRFGYEKSKLNRKSCLNQCLLQQIAQIKEITDNNFQILRNSLFKSHQIQMNRIIILSSTMPFFTSQLLFTYLKQPNILDFYQHNICLPDLLHSTQIALSYIEKYFSVGHTKNNYSFALVNFLSKKIIDIPQKDLQLYTKNINENPQLYFRTFYFQNYQQQLWNQTEKQKVKFFQHPYNLTYQNIINLLKKDPRYLISLMKWNSRQYINEQQVQMAKKYNNTIICSNYAEGMGMKIEQKSKNNQHVYIFTSQLTKNHSYFVPYANKNRTKYHILQGSLKNMIKKSYKFERQ